MILDTLLNIRRRISRERNYLHFSKKCPKDLTLFRVFITRISLEIILHINVVDSIVMTMVIGGIKLYKELCDLRRKRADNDPRHYWGEELEYDFAVAAWAIACHNIFYINKTEEYHWCYTQMGLGRFVYSDNVRKISQKQHLLFFLLCLVDSIEPLKTYSDNSMLHSINLDIQSDKIIIQIDSFPCPCIKTTYMNKVLNLNEWLIDTEYSNNALNIKLDTLWKKYI